MTIELLAKKTDWDRLNDLIDWYEKFKPDAGKMIMVRFSTKELKRFATENENGTWNYRNRLLARVPE